MTASTAGLSRCAYFALFPRKLPSLVPAALQRDEAFVALRRVGGFAVLNHSTWREPGPGRRQRRLWRTVSSVSFWPAAARCGRASDSPIPAAVRPAKAGAFSGRQSHRGKSRSPVARVAGSQLGNRDSEAYRQRHRKGGGESPGCSASEREVASKVSSPGGRASNGQAKAAWPVANGLMRWDTPAGWLSTAW